MITVESAGSPAAGRSILETVEVVTGPEPMAAVIWLHGLGADGHDFEPIVPFFQWPGGPSIRFVFPHAPARPVTVNGGMRMRAWYDIRALQIDRDQDVEAIEESIRQAADLVKREQERGIEAGRIVVAGFSQGGAIAIQCALRYPERLAGLIALSGCRQGEIPRALLRHGTPVVGGAVATLFGATLAAGLDLGWITGLSHGNEVVAWTSPSTAVGQTVGYLVLPFGLHIDALPVTRGIAVLVLAALLVVSGLWTLYFAAAHGDHAAAAQPGHENAPQTITITWSQKS